MSTERKPLTTEEIAKMEDRAARVSLGYDTQGIAQNYSRDVKRLLAELEDVRANGNNLVVELSKQLQENNAINETLVDDCARLMEAGQENERRITELEQHLSEAQKSVTVKMNDEQVKEITAGVLSEVAAK